jgi:serine/threonine protein phosphatase 1
VVWGPIRLQRNKRRPRIPEGVRIYAIGDVHGRCDLLERLLLDIDNDLTQRPIEVPLVVLLGDYIDRGPDSASVLEQLVACRKAFELICLKGNHESLMLQFLDDPSRLDDWIRFGGLSTLVSYGLGPSLDSQTDRSSALIAHELNQALPQSHRFFLNKLRPSFTCGDFYFAHAGVRAGIPLEKQSEHDLLWIREDFLLHEGFFEKIVIHGHTPVHEPQVMPNRINIDTGAYATGRLTCLVLEADHLKFLNEIGNLARD